jgi:hypothetical protein
MHMKMKPRYWIMILALLLMSWIATFTIEPWWDIAALAACSFIGGVFAPPGPPASRPGFVPPRRWMLVGFVVASPYAPTVFAISSGDWWVVAELSVVFICTLGTSFLGMAFRVLIDAVISFVNGRHVGSS